MAWFSSRKTELELADGAISGWDKVRYMAIPLALSAFMGQGYMLLPSYGGKRPEEHFLMWVICSLLAAGLVYTGVRRCYLMNLEIDGRRFMERFIILMFPMFMKFLVMILPLSVFLLLGGEYWLRKPYPQVYAKWPLIVYGLQPIVVYALFFFLRRSYLRFGLLRRKYMETN